MVAVPEAIMYLSSLCGCSTGSHYVLIKFVWLQYLKPLCTYQVCVVAVLEAIMYLSSLCGCST